MKNGVLLVVPFLAVFLLLSAADPSLQHRDIVTQLFSRYKNVKTFQADFHRVFTAKMTGKITKDSGVVRYLAPEFVAMITRKGKSVTNETYITPKKTVFVDHTKKSVLLKQGSSGMSDYLVFLRGPKEIKKSFAVKDSTASIAKARKAGLIVEDGSQLIKLTPKKQMADVRYMFLVVKKNEVISLIIVDQLKNINQFSFSHIIYNHPMKANDFDVPVPKGYEVSHFQ